MQLRTHSNLCVAVLNYLKNSSSLAAAAAAVSPPRLKPPTSPPPGGAYRGPAQTGEPPQRIELGHGSQRVPLPVFSTGPGSLQRDVLSGTSKPQRWLGNLRCSVRAGPAECAPQQTHSCSGPRWWWWWWWWGVFHSPDVKAETSWHAPQLRCTKAHLIINEKSILNDYSITLSGVTKQEIRGMSTLHLKTFLNKTTFLFAFLFVWFPDSEIFSSYVWSTGRKEMKGERQCMGSFLLNPLDGALNSGDYKFWITLWFKTGMGVKTSCWIDKQPPTNKK